MTDRTLVKNSQRRLDAMNSHVCLQVTLGGERASADLTLKRPLTGMRSVMHLQRGLAAEYAMTDYALVRIRHFVLNIVD